MIENKFSMNFSAFSENEKGNLVKESSVSFVTNGVDYDVYLEQMYNVFSKLCVDLCGKDVYEKFMNDKFKKDSCSCSCSSSCCENSDLSNVEKAFDEYIKSSNK